LEEGKAVGTYARELDINRFLMSRYMRCIGDRGRNGGAGLGLVTIKRTREYPSRMEVLLTHKGREVAAQVFEKLRLLRKSSVLT
jgi:hypothetical protein